MKPLMVDLPYPNLNDVCENENLAKIVRPFFAGLHGEITAIMQYVYHAFYFEKEKDLETANLLKSISIAEMRHLELLGRLLLKLGVDPWFGVSDGFSKTFYNTSKISYSKLKEKMLLDDISGEMMAIKEYDRAIDMIKDEKVSAVLVRIKLDEELHVSALKSRLQELYS